MQHEKDCAAIFFREAITRIAVKSSFYLRVFSTRRSRHINIYAYPFMHTLREIQAGLPTWAYRDILRSSAPSHPEKFKGQWLRKNPHTEHIAFTVTGSFDNYSRFPIEPPIISGT